MTSLLADSDTLTDPGLGLRRPSHRKAAFYLLAVALAIRLVFSLVLFSYVQKWSGLTSKSDRYEYIAQTLLQGGGYRFASDLGETMILMPTYPLFLTALFKVGGVSITIVRIAQSILDAITCVWIYQLGRGGLGECTAFRGALLYALYPGAWVACARYVTEPLFVFLITGFLVAFSRFMTNRRFGHLLLAGMSCSLAVLCKSVAGLLPAFLLAVVLLPTWRGQRVRAATGFLVCILITGVGAGAWVWRNYRLTGEIVYPSTLSGLALYTASTYAANPNQDLYISARQAALEVRTLGEAAGIRVDPRDKYPRYFYSPEDELRVDRLARDAARTRIASDRSGYLRHAAGNLWRFWIGAPTATSTVVSAVLNVPLVLLAIVGFVRTKWWRCTGLSLWVATAAYLFLSHVAVLAVVRYSLTVIPLVCILATGALKRTASGQCREDREVEEAI